MIHSITLPGHGRIHAETAGQGEPILFIHADFVDGRMWNAVRDQLADRFLVATFDKLGYGRSDAAVGPVPRRRELKAVVDALDLGPLHLVGCSNGGRQALDFALEYPHLVKSLVLVNAFPSGWEPAGAPPPLILAMIEAFQRGDLPAASELQLQIWFDGPDRSPPSSDGLQAARAEAALMNRVFVDRGTFFVADGIPLEPLDPPALGRLAEVGVPTLVVDGRFDWPENRRASKILADGIAHSRLIEAEGAHVPTMEDPLAFAQLMAGFLTQTPGQPILKVWPSSMRPI